MLDLSTQSEFREPVLDDGKWQVSPAGGDEPVWSPDGQELFYREGTSTNLMAVPVGTEPSFTYETPQNLFRALLHESSLARTIPTDGILTCRCDTTLVGRGRSSD